MDLEQFNASAKKQPVDDFKPVSQGEFLRMTPKQQNAYCAARDFNSANISAAKGDPEEAAWFIHRAERFLAANDDPDTDDNWGYI
jgi:hypothetical protein